MSVVYEGEGGARRYRALSSDEKPIEGVPDGSTWLEKDTGRRYVFDEGARTWYLQARSGSGGGGGGYTLPEATESRLGGIKASDSIQVDPDGTAHAVSCETASDEEVDAMLDRIFGGFDPGGGVSGVCCEAASDEEVNAVLDRVFGISGDAP